VLQPCWHHTLASALIASELARLCGFRPAEVYTAALLHDIGRLGLLTAYPVEYEAILLQTGEQPGGLLEVERANFGVDHVEAGVWLAHEWKLPESIVEVIANHHRPADGPLGEIGIVHMACLLADLLGFAVERSRTLPELEEIVGGLPAPARSRLSTQLPVLRAAIHKEIGLCEGADTPPAPMAAGEGDAVQEGPLEGPTAAPRTRWLAVAGLAGVAILMFALAATLVR